MKLTDLSYIRSLLAENGAFAKKKFGQNFLINEAVPVRIAEEGTQGNRSGVLEIGPGIGTLTVELCRRAKKVVSVEIDTSLLPILDQTLSEFDNVKVINADILNCDLASLVKEEFSDCEDICVCANLPYYITTPVLMYLLESGVKFKCVTVMVQKEVADRLCAKAGSPEYGAITASIAYYGTAKKLFNVSAGSFFPAPKVDSCVICIDLYSENVYGLDLKRKKTLFRIIKAAFGQRRKTLVNALSGEFSNIKKPDLASIIEFSGFPSDIRGEKLSIDDFSRLANNISNLK